LGALFLRCFRGADIPIDKNVYFHFMKNAGKSGVTAFKMVTEILTPTIRLKIVAKTDAEQIHVLRTDADVAQFIIRDRNVTVSDIEHFITDRLSDYQNILFYKIETLPSLELAGTIVLKNIDTERKYAEIGYELFTKFQGRGIMSAALDKLTDLAFSTMGLKTLEAFTHRDNLKSRKLLEKFNFKLTDKTDNKNPNNVIYSLSK
jgi:[ribosomal protein S5]-alanine N-acetyltransferase